MYINSPGGIVTAGLAIYDTMQYIRPPVQTLCVGQAASAASLLLCAGKKGERYCLPNSRILVHQPSRVLLRPGGGYRPPCPGNRQAEAPPERNLRQAHRPDGRGG